MQYRGNPIIFQYGFSRRFHDSTIRKGINATPELNFDGAAFPFPGSKVPVYFKAIEFDPNDNYEYVLESTVQEELKLPEDFPGIDKITDSFGITQKMQLSRENKLLHIEVSVLKKENGKIFRLKSFVLKRIPAAKTGNTKSLNVTKEWKTSSVLNTGKWIKISVTEKGVYKIPYSKLVSWGFTDPAKVNVFGSGGLILSENPGEIEYDDLEQCAVWRDKNNGADCLFFYAPGVVKWNADKEDGIFTHQINDYSSKVIKF